MNDATHAHGPPLGSSGADSLLKRAREAQGLTLEGLAATLKVTPAKLAALEAGRYQDLPDAAFARALAMTVCRVLKIDPAPVMAGLPAAQPINLVSNEQRAVPFDGSRTKLRLNMDLSPSRSKWSSVLAPQWLAPVAVLVAALVVYLWPSHVEWPAWMPAFSTATVQDDANEMAVTPGEPAPPSVPSVPETVEAVAAPVASVMAESPQAASAASKASSASTPVPELSPAVQGAAAVNGAASVVAPGLPATSQPAALAPSSGALVLVASESSWVEVYDSAGKRLLSRLVTAGETVGIDGKAPLAVRIGNAGGVQVNYLGHPVELAAFTRNNVAKLELK